jgi:hypothetical protein
MLLPETVPLSELVAMAVVMLKAFENVPVDPLFMTAERSADAVAAPELR